MITLATISFSLIGSTLVVLLLLLLAIGAAVLFYRFTIPPLPQAKRITLSVLRSLALIVLILILFEPVLRFINRETQPPAVAILIDNSQSMGIHDRSGDRSEAVEKFLRTVRLDNLPGDASVRYHFFSSMLSAPSALLPDSLPFTGQTTDLATVLNNARDYLTTDNLQAVVLISDGNYTEGKNPLYDAEALGVPVFTIGVGDTTEQKDLLVEKVVTNAISYAGVRLPVDVTIKSSGFGGENVEVTLSEGSTVIDRKVLRLQEGTNQYPVSMFAEPKDEGTKRFTVAVSRLEGELTDRNNAQSFFVKVLKSKLRVVILAGAPHPDVAAVRQVLLEDGRFDVQSFVQKNAAEFYHRSPIKASLDSADCLVLVGFPSSATSSTIIRQVQEVCEQLKKPILFVNSKNMDYGKLRLLESLLPFGWSPGGVNEVLVFPSIVDRHRAHALVRLEGNVSEQSWANLPPVYRTATIFRAKPDAQVLAAVKVQNIVLEEPLIVVRTLNRQKTLAITGYGIWRWRLLTQGSAQTERFFETFLSNAVRWLTTTDEDKRVRITPLKESFTTAEGAVFTGQVYDEQLRPVDHAEVRIELDRGGEKFHLALDAVGNGRYEGSMSGLPAGDYSYRGIAVADGHSFGEDRGRFAVGQVNVEFLQTRMNKQLLEQIAYRTGGSYRDVSEGEAIVQQIRAEARLQPAERVRANEVELWNWQYLSGILVLLFALEWFMRKRSGML